MPSSEISHSTAFGQQKVIELPDGSLVTINSKSTIEFNPDSWQSSRILNLSGEAYFKVKKGSQFTVNTPNGDVVVLGTEFNVNSSHNFFEVICYEGKVKVEKNSKAYILTPGKIIRKFNENKLEENFTNKNFPDWTKGESTFVSVPLEFVIKSIEKQYNLTVISNQVDITRVYTGSFTHNNLDVALATVFKTMNIKYLKKDNGIISLE
jgi:ferric-dicitrate binding protein FerR (iron transport regulator)